MKTEAEIRSILKNYQKTFDPEIELTKKIYNLVVGILEWVLDEV